MFLPRLLIAPLLFCIFPLAAQLSSIEIYGGMGSSLIQSSASSFSFDGLLTVGGGENFALRQMGTITDFTSIDVSEKLSSRLGMEAHLALGASGSLYFGVGVQALNFNYSETLLTQTQVSSGPIDTLFFEQPDPINNGGSSICPSTNLSNLNNNAPNGLALDIGVPIGYRHLLFKGKIALRAQVSINVPILVRLRSEATRFEFRPDGCFDLFFSPVNLRDVHSVPPLLFRAGGGFDVRISHSFSVGLIVDQQLNNYFTTTEELVINSGVFAQIPTVTAFKPLTAQLVGRYRLR